MQSKDSFSQLAFHEGIKQILENTWDGLTDLQKIYAKKAWFFEERAYGVIFVS